jgi:hypothetical protein
MDFHRCLFDKLLSLKAVKWHKIFQNLALLVSLFNRVLLVIADGLTKHVLELTLWLSGCRTHTFHSRKYESKDENVNR